MDHFTVLLLALIIDALLGDPPWFYRQIPHPIALIGQLIGAGERLLNRGSERARLITGAATTVAVIVSATVVAWVFAFGIQSLPGAAAVAVEALIVSTLLAWRGLYDHCRAVARGLRQSLQAGRIAVSHIVGRNPQTLDAAGVARATVESAAENFSDAVVAPAFWYALLGLPGLCAYKAINTLDSMIGHHNERYRAFGCVAARIDDAANWLPARLASALLLLAALLWPDADGGRALAALRRDARRHRSPNAGWPEAAMAGALGVALAGPRSYGTERIDGAWMGAAGRTDLTARDIDRALALYCVAGALLVALVTVFAVLV